MNRTWKQISFGSVYLLILVLIIAGIYFLYLKPSPSCTDNRQNQEEAGVDCGGPCIPCEVKGLILNVEEIKYFYAVIEGDSLTLLAKVSNPSQNFNAAFTYEFKLQGVALGHQRLLKGRASIGPGKTEYIVVPALTTDEALVSPEVSLEITKLDWKEPELPPPNIAISSQTDIQQFGDPEVRSPQPVVSGILFNKSAMRFSSVVITAILRNAKGEIVDASLTQLEYVEAFSEKPFTLFFPLLSDVDPTKTIVQWDIDE